MLPMHQSDWNVPAGARIDAELLKALLDYVEDGVCLLDRTNHVLYWNYGAEQITGHLAQEVTGRHCRDGLELCYDCEGVALIDGECPLSKVKHDRKPRESLIYMRHKQGHRLPVRMRAHAILDSNGMVTAVAEIFTRASAQGRTELAEAARHLGHDALTGAQNRAYGEMRLRHELEAKRAFGLELAWMRVDIDGTEGMRYNFGPALIEATMRLMAHTIDANLRSFDGLMRWDETSFRVMVRHAVDQRVRELARRLELMAESSEIQWWGDGRKVRVSIASVMAVEDDTVESLEERVQRAMEASRALKILQS